MERGGRRYVRNYKAKFPPRQREVPPEPPETVIASMLFQIGEHFENESTEYNIRHLLISLEPQLATHKDVFLHMVIPIVFAQPVKTPMYGLLIGLLNANNSELGQEIIDRFCSIFQEAFDSVHPYKIRLLLRFAVELILANVIQSESFTELLGRIIEQCDPEKNGVMLSSATAPSSDCSARSELFLSIVIDILPFIGKTLYQNNKEFLCESLETLNQIFRARSEVMPADARKMLSVFNQGAINASNWAQDRWNQLVNALKPNEQTNWSDLKEEDWNLFEQIIVSPDRSVFATEIEKGAPKTLSDIRIPDHESGQDYERRLRSVFRIYDASKTDSTLAPAGRIVAEQYIIDLFCALNSSHKACMKSILRLDFGVKVERLVVEILFGQILELPRAPYKLIYYGDLIVDGYKTSRDFADALSEAVNILFSKLNELDAECFDRFSEWFSFHLSSIDWKWDWEQWSFILDHPDSSHQRRFVCEVIEQCIRLSYHERVSKTLPESFQILVPTKPAPSFAYEDTTSATALLEKVFERAPGDVLQEFLDDSDIATEDEKLEILFQVLLQRGHKSTTHILKLFERYLRLLQQLITSTNNKITVLNAVQNFWILSPQNIIVIVDKLMTYCIVDNISIIKWILSSKSGNQLRCGYIWIILRKTFEKTKARLETIQGLIKQVDRGEIKFEDDPRDPGSVRERKMAGLQQQKLQSAKELETLLLTAINDFCVLIESPVVGKDYFLLYCVQGHLMELIRKHASFVQAMMQRPDTRSQLLAYASEETALLLEATSAL